jgi:septal ring factor EnvC (AmiA/AmiB activator)
MRACEQRWQKEKEERKQQLSEVLSEWQTHARERREAVTLEKCTLESECKALIELTKMQREAGKAMAELKDSLVQQLVTEEVNYYKLFNILRYIKCFVFLG